MIFSAKVKKKQVCASYSALFSANWFLAQEIIPKKCALLNTGRIEETRVLAIFPPPFWIDVLMLHCLSSYHGEDLSHRDRALIAKYSAPGYTCPTY